MGRAHLTNIFTRMPEDSGTQCTALWRPLTNWKDVVALSGNSGPRRLHKKDIRACGNTETPQGSHQFLLLPSSMCFLEKQVAIQCKSRPRARLCTSFLPCQHTPRSCWEHRGNECNINQEIRLFGIWEPEKRVRLGIRTWELQFKVNFRTCLLRSLRDCRLHSSIR